MRSWTDWELSELPWWATVILGTALLVFAAWMRPDVVVLW